MAAWGRLAMGYSGQSAYGLLEDSYEIVFVSLFVPMVFAVYGWRCSGKAAVASMSSGILVWLVHWLAGWQYVAEPLIPVPFPASLGATAASLLAYLAFCRTAGRDLSG